MTYKEKLKEENPSAINDKYIGGCSGCPHEYHYEDRKTYQCYPSRIKCEECWNREMPKEDKKMFTKNDLKDGMIVETKEGKRYMIMKDMCVGSTCYMSLRTHNDDLTYDFSRDLDIMKVYENNADGSFVHLIKNPGRLIWSRNENIKEITAEEAAQLLKEKFPEYSKIKIMA